MGRSTPDPTWKRPPGRPRTTWTDQLRRDNYSAPIATLWRQAIGRGHSRAGFLHSPWGGVNTTYFFLYTPDQFELVTPSPRGRTKHFMNRPILFVGATAANLQQQQTHSGKEIRKINNFAATRSQILRLKCT